jgi:hypothetical protein
VIPFSEDEQEQEAGAFTLDGRLGLRQIVGQVTDQANTESASPWVSVFEDDERR